MLYAFGFDRLGVVLSDLYFVDPNPGKNMEGAEQGVRLELRMIEAAPLQGGVYSATPIEIQRPIWRVDMLESVDNPGSFDRTHHHPEFTGWEPSKRNFVPELSADPLGWLRARLVEIDPVLDAAGVIGSEIGPDDRAALAAAADDIVASAESLLTRVRAGELARPPAELTEAGARVSWL